jgi:hypothetical protein
MNAQLQACHQDLERLLPYWLGLPADEQEWQLQRWMDLLEARPELLRLFVGALLQRVTAFESAITPVKSQDYHLSRALLNALSLLDAQQRESFSGVISVD